jgi:L-lactate dehydrogenase (cytochrome)
LVDPTTVPVPEIVVDEDEIQRQRARDEMPSPEDMLLLRDFEDWAERVLSKKAWAYYRSAADEEKSKPASPLMLDSNITNIMIAFHENRDAFQRYFFRPRVLRDMTTGTTNTSFVGIPTSTPIFISPAAMAKLGHPLGEINIVKAAGDCGIPLAVSYDYLLQHHRSVQQYINT